MDAETKGQIKAALTSIENAVDRVEDRGFGSGAQAMGYINAAFQSMEKDAAKIGKLARESEPREEGGTIMAHANGIEIQANLVEDFEASERAEVEGYVGSALDTVKERVRAIKAEL